MAFYFNSKITFNKKYLTYVIFNLQLTYHIHNTRSIFNNYFVLISSRNSQQMFKISSTYNNERTTRLIMDCLTLSMVPGRMRMVCPVHKRVGEVSLHFQLELNALAFFCPHRQKSKELCSGEQGGYLENKVLVDIY